MKRASIFPKSGGTERTSLPRVFDRNSLIL